MTRLLLILEAPIGSALTWDVDNSDANDVMIILCLTFSFFFFYLHLSWHQERQHIWQRTRCGNIYKAHTDHFVPESMCAQWGCFGGAPDEISRSGPVFFVFFWCIILDYMWKIERDKDKRTKKNVGFSLNNRSSAQQSNNRHVGVASVCL